MRALPVALVTVLLTAACAPAPKAADPEAETRPVAVVATPAPAGAMAKRAPPQPGEQVSPVIAFRGGGEHWTLQIENAGGYVHDVNFSWASGNHHATGALQYRGQPGAAAAAPILLEGTLATPAGPRAMRVEITAAACTDAADQAYTHAVRVAVAGMAPMLGCGDLAK